MSEITPADAAIAPAISFAQQTSIPAAPQPSPDPSPEPEPTPNCAVQRCIDARNRAFHAERAKGKDGYDSNKAGNEAYLQVMPTLSGLRNIQDFIACVAQGMMIDRFLFDDASKLLYAAQVALTSMRREPKSKSGPA